MPLNEEYNRQIIEIVEKHRFSYATVLNSNKCKHLHDYIYEFTKDFSDLSFPARIYWTLNDIHEYPRCQNPKCPTPGGKELRHDIRYRPLSGHNEHHCCNRCAQEDPATQKKMMQNSLKKYGYEHPQQHPDKRKSFSEKLKSLPQEHWDRALEKRVETNMREHGVINVSQREDVKQKVSKAWDDKTDDEVSEIIGRTRKTKLERFGDENFINTEKAYETRIKHFGTFWTEEQLEQRKKTNLERYGVEEPNQREEVRQKYRMLSRMKYRPTIYKDIVENDQYVQPLFTLDEFLHHDDEESKLKWRCKKCGREFEQNHGDHQFKVDAYVRCLHCFPLLAAKSQTEKDIAEFVGKCISDQVICNSRKIISPRELDIYMPRRKLAIEIDGTYWHSVNQETPLMYHVEKQNACVEKKIKLVHIYDLEWLCAQDKVKSFIRSQFNIFDRHMSAAKCKAKMIDSDMFHQFMTENSLVHEIEANDYIGLFDGEALIAACSLLLNEDLRQTHIQSLCFKMGVKVPGALRKIVREVKKQFGSCSDNIFFVQQRRFGDVRTRYESQGFTFVELTGPNQVLWDRKRKDLNLTVDSDSYMKPISEDIVDVANRRNEDKVYTILDSGNLVFKFNV